MEITKTLYAKNRDQFRSWLEKNHNRQNEIWLVFYKKHTGKPVIPYSDAVEEALCFGWIDSTIKSVDHEKYVQRFTPRNKRSAWSALNIERLKKMIQQGRMTQAGLDKAPGMPGKKIQPPAPKTPGKLVDIPTDIEKELKTNPVAWKNFCNMAPSHKRNYIRWIDSAKKEETRIRRIKKAIALLEKNEKPGML